MTNTTHILVATDFSDHSDAALEYARGLADKLGARIDLVHVFNDPFVNMAYGMEVYVTPPPELRDVLWTEAETNLKARVPKAQTTAGAATSHILTGTPAAAIVEYATAQNVDLIVMGTHGRGGVAHLFLGSVAERVVRAATCPVLTVRGLPTAATVCALEPAAV